MYNHADSLYTFQQTIVPSWVWKCTYLWSLPGCNCQIYSCFKGYLLQGNSQQTCQPAGQWDGSVPTCQCKYNYNMYNISPYIISGELIARLAKHFVYTSQLLSWTPSCGLWSHNSPTWWLCPCTLYNIGLHCYILVPQWLWPSWTTKSNLPTQWAFIWPHSTMYSWTLLSWLMINWTLFWSMHILIYIQCIVTQTENCCIELCHIMEWLRYM